MRLALSCVGLITCVLFVGCSTLFGPSGGDGIAIQLPRNAIVVRPSTGDTLAHNQGQTDTTVFVDLCRRQRHALTVRTDSSTRWLFLRPTYQTTSLWNLLNHFGSAIDGMTAADRALELVSRKVRPRAQLHGAEQTELDTIATQWSGIDGNVSILDERQEWTVAITARVGFVGPVSQAVLFGNAANISVGVRPVRWLEVGYDYVSASIVSVGVLDETSIPIHSAYVMVREPWAGFTMRLMHGQSAITGIVQQVGQAERTVSGTIRPWALGVGFSSQWTSIEFRRILVPLSDVAGQRIVSSNTSILWGVNIVL
ncbi:MAG: hypothetical protein MUC47_03170 [Candidatus Kapabacteria bacterium]|nr:hypothetical protein [Candidatus Kapabacteria bacterium]